MYRVRNLAPLVLLFALLSPAFAVANNKPDKKQSGEKKLASEIEQILSDPEAARGFWGIYAVSMDSGKPLYALNQDKLFTPASNTKLFTTADVFGLIGPDYRFTTTVETSGMLDKYGRLNSDLVLVGRGDPNLSGRTLPYNMHTERKTPPIQVLQTLADQLVQQGSDYVIGADDMLRISVWKEPDLSETLPVRPDGKISMPLLNDIPAAGLTPLQLKDSITEKLKKFIADPRVTVVVTAMNSRRIFVTGEVTHTGPMPLLPDMTMLQALSQAGFTQFANLKGIYLLRTENGKQEKLPFNYKDVIKGNHPEQNIVLKPGDTVVVP